MTLEKKTRRPKGPAAIGNIHQTKVVVSAMIENESEERRKKTEKLRALREANSAPDIKAGA
jgi:hypothetical protein